MEWTCSKEKLEDILQNCVGIVASKSTIPMLSHVLLECKGESLEISATDLEVAFKTSIQANVSKEGSITIPARKLSEVIRSMRNGEVHFTKLEQDRIQVSAVNSRIKTQFKLLGLPKENYPKIPEFSGKKVLSIEQSKLREMIRQTIFCTSNDQIRYYLNGILFEKEDGNQRFRLVASDGKRLALILEELEEQNTEEQSEKKGFRVVVPFKILNELVKILKNEGSCDILLTESKVFFDLEDSYFIANLLEGEFPDYKQVVPNSFEQEVELKRDDVIDTLKGLAPMIDVHLPQIKFYFSEGHLLLKAQHSDLGEAKDEIECSYSGKNFAIAFNYQYVLDALREMVPEKVLFKMNTNRDPVLVQGLDKENYLCVIMPMRITETFSESSSSQEEQENSEENISKNGSEKSSLDEKPIEESMKEPEEDLEEDYEEDPEDSEENNSDSSLEEQQIQ